MSDQDGDGFASSATTEGAASPASKAKIFCFVNSGAGTDWQVVEALSEDGHFLARHVSSSLGFAKHDIGLTSDWKHERYRERYPNGYELEWVDDPRAHEGIKAAYEKHLALAREIEARKLDVLGSSFGKVPQ